MAGLVRVRLLLPPEHADDAIALLLHRQGVTNVVRIAGAALDPVGDLVQCDVAREAANSLIAALDTAGVHSVGSVSVSHASLSIGLGVTAALDDAPGEADSTVLWAEVAAHVARGGRPSPLYFTYFVVAALIATAGVLTDSPILIVGAMVVGPEYGPIAAMSWAIQQRRFRDYVAAALTGAIGSAAAIAAAGGFTLVLRAFDRIPEGFFLGGQTNSGFIIRPDIYSAVVASAAAVAGVLSLAYAHSGTLVGVLVSVTTIPAIAAMGIGAAVGDWHGAWGALGQLVVNIGCLVTVGAVTLAVLRRWTPGSLQRRGGTSSSSG
jgi:uncharacterized hydrophobic protein (TIGR00271 family)